MSTVKRELFYSNYINRSRSTVVKIPILSLSYNISEETIYTKKTIQGDTSETAYGLFELVREKILTGHKILKLLKLSRR